MAYITQGILCRENRTFYWLETGPMSSRNTIDRLRSILMRRDLISYHRTDPNKRDAPYKIMTLEEAQEKNLDIECIYINKHVEKIMTAEKEKTGGNPWAQ